MRGLRGWIVGVGVWLAAGSAQAQELPGWAEAWGEGGERGYVVDLRGQELGVSWAKIEGVEEVDPDGDGPLERQQLVRMRVKSELDGDSVNLWQVSYRLELEVWLDAAGLPVRLDGWWRQPSGGVRATSRVFRDRVTVSEGMAVDLVGGRGPLLVNGVVPLFDLAVRLSGVYALPEEQPTVETRWITAKGVGVDVEVRVRRRGGEAWVIADSLGDRFDATPERGVSLLHGGGATFRLVEEAQEPAWTLRDQPACGYPMPEDASWTDESVRIPYTGEAESSEGFLIAGTLSVPQAEVWGEGPYPAVLFVSGSGTQDRLGASAGMDLGSWEVQNALAAEGYVVLRVDDRGAGGTAVGVPDASELGYRHLVDDARSCVRWLAARPNVDPERVVVLGHSEGALTAALLAVEDGGLAGVVSMAGCARNLRDVSLEQAERMMAELPEAQREYNLELSRRVWAAALAGEEPAEVPPQVLAQFRSQARWMREHQEVDVPETWRQVDVPVLILQGASDIQVLPSLDAGPMAALLLEGGNTDVTLRVFPELDHLLMPCPDGVSTLGLYRDRSRSVAPEALAELRRWARRVAGR